MNKKECIGTYIYMEWLFPIKDYYTTTSRKELLFEVGFPFIVGVVVCSCCYIHDVVSIVIRCLADDLLTLLSILIGFSIMLITTILTSGGDGINKLKEKTINKKINNKEVNLFQKLYIQFVYSLICEITLLCIILFYYFIITNFKLQIFEVFFLMFFVYKSLNILLSILRGVTNIYFSYYNTPKID